MQNKKEHKMPRYKDIDKFTPEPTYSVDIDLESLESNLDRYKDRFGLKMNPDFQRGHVWTEDQQIAYVEYLLRGGASGRVIYFNCAGWGRLPKGPMVCVDGLQRVTAALRFMRGEIKAFGYYEHEYEDQFPWSECTFNIKINSLATRAEVLKWYLDLNTGGTVHTADELNRVRGILAKEK